MKLNEYVLEYVLEYYKAGHRPYVNCSLTKYILNMYLEFAIPFCDCSWVSHISYWADSSSASLSKTLSWRQRSSLIFRVVQRSARSSRWAASLSRAVVTDVTEPVVSEEAPAVAAGDVAPPSPPPGVENWNDNKARIDSWFISVFFCPHSGYWSVWQMPEIEFCASRFD